MSGLRNIGRLGDAEIREAVLQSGSTQISILNYGCVVRDWRHDGVPMVLGFDRFEDYPKHSRSFGIIAGRVANRTAYGRFSLDGKDYLLPTNNGAHHLHGGITGLGRRVWDMEFDERANAVELRYHSPDLEEGYPGTVDFRVVYTLSGATLRGEMHAVPDRRTPINLAQHSYYNLDGSGDVRRHQFQMDADRYLPVDADLIPTGARPGVEHSRFDFRQPRSLEDADPDGIGFDHNLILREDRLRDHPAVVVRSSSRELKLWTDQPGIQFFTAPQMEIPVPGIDGLNYGPSAGFCVEAQRFPDSLNRPTFPSVIFSPDSHYFQRLAVDISYL